LDRYKVDAFYLTNADNIRYLTGFKGSFGVAIIIRNEIILVTDSRYLEEAKKVCKGVSVIDVIDKTWEKILHSAKVIVFESRNMTVERFEKLKKKYNKSKWISSFPIIENMRRQKNQYEITVIKKACKITQDTLKKAIRKVKKGMSEVDLAWEIEQIAKDEGADRMSFETIVAFEENSTYPHHMSSASKKLRKGDTILIDFGVKYHGYCSDLTRTFFYKEVTPEKEKIFKHVLRAQEIGIKNIKTHNSCKKAYLSVKEYLKKEGLDEFFTHSLGHGVGLNVHEFPNISDKSPDYFLDNEIITCEPGLYIPGKFGVRIEDMGVITNSKFQYISHFPRDLQVLH